jgi:hypothetical protein
MDTYELEALMRFTASVIFNGLSAKADNLNRISANANTLIDTNASLTFVSKEFVMVKEL